MVRGVHLEHLYGPLFWTQFATLENLAISTNPGYFWMGMYWSPGPPEGFGDLPQASADAQSVRYIQEVVGAEPNRTRLYHFPPLSTYMYVRVAETKFMNAITRKSPIMGWENQGSGFSLDL